ERALGAVLTHHDALRLRFRVEDGAWRQSGAEPDDGVPCARIAPSPLPAARAPPAFEAAAAALQASLDLARGPLLRAGWLDLAADPATRPLLALHPLAFDHVPLRV